MSEPLVKPEAPGLDEGRITHKELEDALNCVDDHPERLLNLVVYGMMAHNTYDYGLGAARGKWATDVQIPTALLLLVVSSKLDRLIRFLIEEQS
jgi:uncharacterized membrane protein